MKQLCEGRVAAGAGRLMTRLAGEVADGFLAHGFTTPEYQLGLTAQRAELLLRRLRASEAPRASVRG